MRGLSAFTAVPSGRYARPSAENPGSMVLNPRSTTASTGRPAHSRGTRPVSRNQLVVHAGPHRSPTRAGS